MTNKETRDTQSKTKPTTWQWTAWPKVEIVIYPEDMTDFYETQNMFKIRMRV